MRHLLKKINEKNERGADFDSLPARSRAPRGSQMPKECRTLAKPPLNAHRLLCYRYTCRDGKYHVRGRGMDTLSRRKELGLRKELREAGQKGAVAFRFGSFALV